MCVCVCVCMCVCVCACTHAFAHVNFNSYDQLPLVFGILQPWCHTVFCEGVQKAWQGQVSSPRTARPLCTAGGIDPPPPAAVTRGHVNLLLCSLLDLSCACFITFKIYTDIGIIIS